MSGPRKVVPPSETDDEALCPDLTYHFTSVAYHLEIDFI